MRTAHPIRLRLQLFTACNLLGARRGGGTAGPRPGERGTRFTVHRRAPRAASAGRAGQRHRLLGDRVAHIEPYTIGSSYVNGSWMYCM